MDKDKEIARLKKELEDAKLRLELVKLEQHLEALKKKNNELLIENFGFIPNEEYFFKP